MNWEILTLQELSFNVIIKEFTKYSSVYLTATDEGLKKCLHFLQRRYTSEIFTQLEQNGSLKKEHLDFLLNENLKKVDVGVLSSLLKKEEIIERVSKIGHSLVELSIKTYCHRSCLSTFKALLPYSPNLTKVRVFSICDNEVLKLIAGSCFQLSELDVMSSYAVTGVGISALCESKNKLSLKVVNINYTGVEMNDVAKLLHCMPTLQDVSHFQLPDVLYSMHKQNIVNNDLDKVAKYNLINLNFDEYSEISLQEDSRKDRSMLVRLLSMCSELCPLVKIIVVPIRNPEELQLCSQFSELESVTIHCESYTFVELNNFLMVRGAKLKKLYVNSCTLSISTLIASCCNLEVLRFYDIQFQKLDKKVSKSLPKLKNFNFNTFSVDDNYGVESLVMLLKCSSNLDSVSFLHCDVRNSELMANLSNVPFLSFDISDVILGHLRHIISNCNRLKKLSIRNCYPIASKDIDILKQTCVSTNKSIEIEFHADKVYSL